jgi:DNA invertase Pin-like site-specific DNA recombinase
MRSILQSGVDIVTLSDGQRYSKGKLIQLESLLVALVRMSTAHAESQQKSERVREAWQAKKRRAAEHKEALTRHGVAWCEVRERQYVLIPERAEIIRRIYKERPAGWGT